MRDTKTIVADTLRAMMGAAAADPYVKAIERAIVDEPVSLPAPPARYYFDDAGVPEKTNRDDLGRWVRWDDIKHLFAE